MQLVRLLLLSSIILLEACSMPTNQTKTILINESSVCNPLFLQVGQELQVSLPTNPSTGYSWSIAILPDSLSIIDANKIIYPENHTMLVGVPGTAIWRYKVEKIGSGTLQLDYQQGWTKKETLAAKMFSCQIIVN